MNALKDALYSKLTADTDTGGLMTIVTGVYNTVAPRSAEVPYLLYQLIDGDDSYTLTQRLLTRYRCQIKCIDESLSDEIAESAIARVDVLLTDAAMSIDGRTLLYMRRQSTFKYLEFGGARYQQTGVPFQHVGADFIIDVR